VGGFMIMSTDLQEDCGVVSKEVNDDDNEELPLPRQS
jgi:hypothetical protein